MADQVEQDDPIRRAVLLVGGDVERWSRVSLEYQRRERVMGSRAAGESVLADVEADRL